MDEVQKAVEKVTVRGFAAEMQEKGIHVGMGSNPRCVTCGETWPCAASVAVEQIAGLQ